jgi:hypothetical protein
MDDGLKPIGVHSQGLVASLKKYGNLTHLLPKTDPEAAVSRAQMLLGCYRRDEVADGETYAAAIAAVLAEYSPDIVRRVTDPRTGLPATKQWLPTVKEVKDTCDELEEREKRIRDMAAREERQLAERRAWLERKA